MEKDCCKEEKGSKGFEEQKSKSMLEYVLLSMVAVILVLALFQSVQINSLKNTMIQGVSAAASMTSSGAAGAGGKINTAGWTEDEKMMYEHHGTVPARLQGKGQSAAPSTGMVGGC